MELLRRKVEEAFLNNGLTKNSLSLSQELDVSIVMEQRRRLEEYKKNNKRGK